MKTFTVTTLIALSLVGSGVVIGVKYFPKEAESVKAPLVKTQFNRTLLLKTKNDGCVMFDESGKRFEIKGNAGDKILIPKGTKFTSECLSFE